MLRYTPREFEALTLWEIYDIQKGYADSLRAQGKALKGGTSNVKPMTKKELEELMRRFPDEKPR